jgi:hypothetical protein
MPLSPSIPARRLPQDGRTLVASSCMLVLPEWRWFRIVAASNRPHRSLPDSLHPEHFERSGSEGGIGRSPGEAAAEESREPLGDNRRAKGVDESDVEMPRSR